MPKTLYAALTLTLVACGVAGATREPDGGQDASTGLVDAGTGHDATTGVSDAMDVLDASDAADARDGHVLTTCCCYALDAGDDDCPDGGFLEDFGVGYFLCCHQH